MIRACTVCQTPTDRHIFENVDGQVIDAFCDRHCPRCCLNVSPFTSPLRTPAPSAHTNSAGPAS